MMTTMLFQGRPRKMWQLRKHRAASLRCQGGYMFIFNGIKKHHFLSKEATSPCQGHLNCVTFLINFGVNIWDLDIDLHSAKVLGLGKEMKELKYDYRNNMIIEGMLNILTRSSSWLSSSSSSPGSRCDQQPRRHLEVPGRSRRSARGGQFKTSKIFAGEGKISRKTNTFFVYRRKQKKKRRNE